MTTETKILSGILIFSAIFILGAVFLLSKQAPKPTTNQTVYQIDYSTGHKVGSDSAKLKLAEFSDFQCPACKAFEPTIQQIRQQYKDHIEFIYKHFPLPQHLNSKAAANFAEYAATQNKFWEVHDKLFETQDSWANLQNPDQYFADLGKSFGLDETKVKEAADKSLYNDIINRDQTEGNNLGVNATPTLFLNGKKLNLQSFTDLDNAIKQELNK